MLNMAAVSSFKAVFKSVQLFNKMVERKMKLSPVNGLNVYPEGKSSLPRHLVATHIICNRKA